MGVGGVGRGGGKGRAGGPKGPGEKGPASGKTFGKTDGASGVQSGPSAAVGSEGLMGAKGADPIALEALSIAQQLKNGTLASRDEATRKLVARVLKERLKMKSGLLTHKIADAIQEDPRLKQALDRLWSQAE